MGDVSIMQYTALLSKNLKFDRATLSRIFLFLECV